jgi:hypothetical protein
MEENKSKINILEDSNLMWHPRSPKQDLTKDDIGKVVRFRCGDRNRYAIIESLDSSYRKYHCIRRIWGKLDLLYQRASTTSWWNNARDKRFKYFILDGDDSIIIKLALNM